MLNYILYDAEHEVPIGRLASIMNSPKSAYPHSDGAMIQSAYVPFYHYQTIIHGLTDSCAAVGHTSGTASCLLPEYAAMPHRPTPPAPAPVHCPSFQFGFFNHNVPFVSSPKNENDRIFTIPKLRGSNAHLVHTCSPTL